MSRTHVKSSYGFRSLGIAGFVVAISFFVNTVPALAAGTALDAGGIYGTRDAYNGPMPGSALYAGGIQSGARSGYYCGYSVTSGTGYACVDSSGGNPTSTQYMKGYQSGGSSSRSDGHYDSYGSKGAGSPGQGRGGYGNGGTPTLSDLQDQLQKLTALKDQLEKLIASLQNSSTTTKGRFTHCPQYNRPASGEVITPTTRVCIDDSGMYPGRFGTTTPFLRGCVNNDPRRCTDAFHASTSAPTNGQQFKMFNPGSFGGGSTSAFGPTNSGGGGFSSGGQVRGASTDQSAELADMLGTLTSDLLDMRDSLDQ